jgi:adenine C2-methylase RlmN of 23S rRNA A2503 and tRNA A37
MTATAAHRKDPRKTFLDVPVDDVLDFAKKYKVAPFHIRNAYDWFFKKEAGDFRDMTNLPSEFRGHLEAA